MLRFSHINSILGSDLYEKICNCRVLVVGSGGIGCELLKNLVMSGFKQIVLVYLSNLNRQFLFQKQHIKKSKAQVARESALKFNPNVNIIAHHANIKDLKFNVEWFKGFDIVMNALDNLDARRHVNTMCLAADVSLIESGSEGYLGQVTIIKKGETECYECQPKPTRTTYPVCTIRSTPSSPIHCIVWAKSYLFNQLFGLPEDDDELDQEINSENEKEIANLKEESQALKRVREAIGSDDYPKIVFKKVFQEDINRLLTMEDMWKTRNTPDQRLWSLTENFCFFLESTQKLSTRLLKEKSINPDAILQFDKDDEDALRFVTATSNLRARIFGIEEKTQFQVKAMAGNIIPAIATTNAIVAGMIVMQAFKVLNGKINECQTKATLRDFIEKIVQSQDDGGMDISEASVEEGGREIFENPNTWFHVDDLQETTSSNKRPPISEEVIVNDDDIIMAGDDVNEPIIID
ncbi:10487_t:CDS:10 [Diversispora eburnea]|uniref:10487_t:CDS:1 n=1 Tax=Diversispora eburnea TaxID=1213867 RepID=A0A9N8VQT3_9GLOM|nr:10487_t:CDS:10 [Diversispora eburnea]